MINKNNLKHTEYKLMAIGIGCLLLFISLLLIVYPVQAAPDDIFNMTVFNKGDNYIQWSYYDDDAITSASYDGVTIINFDAKSLNFTASDLTPNSYHTFCAYSFDDYKCVITNTTYTQSSGDKILESIWVLITFFLGTICIIVGFKEPIFAFGGFIFGCVGIVTSLNNSFIMGTLFMILIVASIFVAFRRD